MSQTIDRAADAVPVVNLTHQAETKSSSTDASRQYLIWRFWASSLGYWRRGASATAWPLVIGLAAYILVNLGIDLVLNRWNKWFFDAIEQKNAAAVIRYALIYVPLTAAVFTPQVAVASFVLIDFTCVLTFIARLRGAAGHV